MQCTLGCFRYYLNVEKRKRYILSNIFLKNDTYGFLLQGGKSKIVDIFCKILISWYILFQLSPYYTLDVILAFCVLSNSFIFGMTSIHIRNIRLFWRGVYILRLLILHRATRSFVTIITDTNLGVVKVF